MEQFAIWIGAAALFAVIFVPYLVRFRSGRRSAVRQKNEAVRAGLDRPRLQFPHVDAATCIGCGNCVRACPEGDVLGVVHGTAAVINGVRCVGHGYCAEVCPVGAITIGLGDAKSRDDIPILTEFNETSVPGLFIAGELGGIALIRNAISQGKMVVEQIAKKTRSSRDRQMPDLAIIGAGPAGLAAALTAIHHKLNYIILEELDIGGTILHYPRHKLVMTQPVEIPLFGWLKKEEYSKEFLLEMWQKIASQFKLNIRTGEKVERVNRKEKFFEIHTQKGYHCAQSVVLALGRRGAPRKLGVPGEEQPKVMYQLIDAQSYTRQNFLVAGGGDAGVEAAIGLAEQTGNNVWLSYRKDSLLKAKKKNEERIREFFRKGKIKPLPDSKTLEIKEKSAVLEFEGHRLEIPNDYVFVFIGGVPPFEMLKKMGIVFGGGEAKPAARKSQKAGVG